MVFHALVKNGRITLDEPSDLPDGQVVLLPLEELLAAAEDVGDANEPMLFQIAAPPREFKKQRPVDAAAIIAELRAL
jgi:hypothetical protein